MSIGWKGQLDGLRALLKLDFMLVFEQIYHLLLRIMRMLSGHLAVLTHYNHSGTAAGIIALI
jgi:hypothetical protein